LRFGFIFEKFLKLKGSNRAAKGLYAAYYVIPVIFSLTIGTMHYVNQSFLVYLRYQALVDEHYH